MFKKTLGLMMAITVFALAACGQTPAQNSDTPASSDSAVSSKAPHSLPTRKLPHPPRENKQNPQTARHWWLISPGRATPKKWLPI